MNIHHSLEKPEGNPQFPRLNFTTTITRALSSFFIGFSNRFVLPVETVKPPEATAQ